MLCSAWTSMTSAPTPVSPPPATATRSRSRWPSGGWTRKPESCSPCCPRPAASSPTATSSGCSPNNNAGPCSPATAAAPTPAATPPLGWLDAHHVTDWQHTHRTCVDDGALVCGPHHDTFQKMGWRSTMLNGRPHWIPPDWVDPDRTTGPQPPARPAVADPVGKYASSGRRRPVTRRAGQLKPSRAADYRAVAATASLLLAESDAARQSRTAQCGPGRASGRASGGSGRASAPSSGLS